MRLRNKGLHIGEIGTAEDLAFELDELSEWIRTIRNDVSTLMSKRERDAVKVEVRLASVMNDLATAIRILVKEN